MFYALKKAGNFVGCSVNYAVTLQGIKQYAMDHNNKLPPAKNWQDDIIPYMSKRGQSVAKMFGGTDPHGNLGCPGTTNSPATGVAYNKSIAGKDLSSVLGSDIILFEVKSTARNQCLPYKPQPGFSPQKIGNDPRPWLWINLNGTTSMTFGSNFQSGNDSALPNQPSPADNGGADQSGKSSNGDHKSGSNGAPSKSDKSGQTKA